MRICVRGVVQGVGFRPFVYSIAASSGLSGSVRNDSSGAVIEIEGAARDVDGFISRLRNHPPPLAVIESIETEAIGLAGGTGFLIADTSHSAGGRTLVSPDVAMCAECAAEQRDPANRRYRHAFVNCTDCGPRFTIIGSLPYDRAGTAMAEFEMCSDCAREYADPDDRRFHAQPVCCPNCGPALVFRDSRGRETHLESGLQLARKLLRSGGVLAVKGIGGYHLACDAANPAAVAELRNRKKRRDKPFAVMVADLAAARHLAEVDEAAARVLSGPRRPIVLLPRLPDARVTASVAPHNPDLGIMLAYSPVHVLLFGLPGDEPGPPVLVMTSGNLSGEPIAFSDDDAFGRLDRLADGWLWHNREILTPCDDSVVRVFDGAELPIRRSRGYSPLPVALPVSVPPTLAVGADLKNTLAVAEGGYGWLSQHLGDMDDLATLSAFDSTRLHLETLTGIEPEVVVVDAHPGYRSAAWAGRNAGTRPIRPVQHHHAHIAAVLAEHGETGPVIGVAYDGTGYGPDGAVWGGEILVADLTGYRRMAHLRYAPLPGGDLAARRPWRALMGYASLDGSLHTVIEPVTAQVAPAELALVERQLAARLNAPLASSMGRLFDAAAAVLGLREVAGYEGQAAMELEALADGRTASEYPMPLEDEPDGTFVLDPLPMLVRLGLRRKRGGDLGDLAADFHASIARGTELAVRRVAEQAGLRTVVLGGGVFQNARLLTSLRTRLERCRFRVLTARDLPPNDGAVSYGQAAIAAAQLARRAEFTAS